MPTTDKGNFYEILTCFILDHLVTPPPPNYSALRMPWYVLGTTVFRFGYYGNKLLEYQSLLQETYNH